MQQLFQCARKLDKFEIIKGSCNQQNYVNKINKLNCIGIIDAFYEYSFESKIV